MSGNTFSFQQQSYIQDFWRRRTEIADHVIATRIHDTNAHVFDLRFILPHIRPGGRVLDMGAGSGILSKAVAELAGSVVAVDPFVEFYADQYRAPNITVVQGDLHSFEPDERFDVIILFGVMQNVDGQSRPEVYARMHRLLASGGQFLVRHACGVDGDVFVDHHSEQIGSHYVAFYQHLSEELRTLETLFHKVHVRDIYPPYLNRWKNTHYYAFHCLKGSA